MKSIRRYLTIWLIGGLGITVVVSVAVIVFIARDGVTREFDRALLGKARSLGMLLAVDEEGVEFEFDGLAMPEFERDEKPEYFEVWLGKDQVLSRSLSLDGGDLKRPPGDDDVPVTWDVDLPDGRPGRAVKLLLIAAGDDADPEQDSGQPSEASVPLRASVVVAVSRAPLDESITKLVLTIGGAVAITCLVIMLLVALTVRRGLAPLFVLGERVDDMDSSTLSSRLPTSSLPRELSPLVLKLNELLTRLESGFERERRVSASMAHELRTPIAEIQSAAEIARKWPDDESLGQEAIVTAHEVSTQMGRVVDALLRLSRTESGREPLEPESVDLSHLLNDIWSHLEAQVSAKALGFSATSLPDLTAHTDSDLVGFLARNLADNAVSHTPGGGRVESTLAQEGDDVIWHLINSPVDLVPEDLDRLAEPLWTKESVRSDREHAGLGLTLVSAVAPVLGITVAFKLEGDALRTTVRIPRSSCRNREIISR